MKSRNIYICVAVAFLSLNSCTDSWLEPKPLSFHTPEDTYVGVDGFEATLSACEAEMHDEYIWRWMCHPYRDDTIGYLCGRNY